MSEDQYVSFDLGELKIREIEELEEITGRPFDQLFAEGSPRGKVMRAIGYITKKREDPDFTMEQAGDLVFKAAPSVDPTEPGAATE